MADQPATWTEGLDELFKPFNRSDAPGLVVGVAKDGKTIYRRAFGLANVEHGVANTPKTRMRIGSTTKHFTALAALLLAEDGKLDLDASIRKYIPELNPGAGEPTLRQLLSHSGGLRCYIDTGFLADGHVVHPAQDALDSQVRQTEANFAPGERMIYCNGGYNLVSLAIERVTGQPFETVMSERIFQPMGMPDTQSIPSDMEVHPGLAGLYVPRDGSWRRGIFVTEGLRGEGAMVSSVDDMLRWLAHLRAAKKVVGSAESWKQLMTPPTLNSGFKAAYALGIILDQYRGVPVIHHGGSVTGGQCQMITATDQALDIIIITNGVPANPDDLGNRIMDLILGDEVLAPKAEPVSSEQHKALIGRYRCERSGVVMGLADTDGKLGLSILTGIPAPLSQTDDGLLLPFVKTVVGHFVIKETATPGVLEISDSGNPDLFKRLPDEPPTVDEIAPLLGGSFYAPDLEATAGFKREGEALELRIQGPYGRSIWALEPMGDETLSMTFKGKTPWRAVVNIRRAGDGISGFSITSLRTRSLRFERQDA
jgi:CubicO group peptidase (beta-lactamase class C family)